MRVKSFKYLGLTLDKTLNWNEHVNELCKSLIKYFVIFNHIKYKITPVVMRQLYYAFIYSMIKYGIELYGSSSASNMNKVQVIQNKLLKMVLKLDTLMPTNDLHKNITRQIWWMTLENNRASLLCCFKLCATFHSHRWIQTGVTVRKRPIWVKFDDF